MRPYTLSKKLLALVTLQFSLATNSRFSKIESNDAERLVGLTRVELVTSSLSGTRSNQLSYKPETGGGSRIRTGDMLLAKQPLYQLSYTPSRVAQIVSEGKRNTLLEACVGFNFAARRRLLLRKEVIQPLVPQRLPCYDFIPITTHTLDGQTPGFGCRRLS